METNMSMMSDVAARIRQISMGGALAQAKAELEARLAKIVEALAHGFRIEARIVSALGELVLPAGKVLDVDDVAEVLSELGLTDQHLRDAVEARTEHLLRERAALAREEPRLRAEADKAKAAYMKAKDDHPVCEHCGQDPKKKGPVLEAKKAWDAAKRAWGPHAQALQALRDYHVPRELHDQDDAARIRTHAAERELFDARSQLREAEALVREAEAVRPEEPTLVDQRQAVRDTAAERVKKIEAELGALAAKRAELARAIEAALAEALRVDEPKGRRK